MEHIIFPPKASNVRKQFRFDIHLSYCFMNILRYWQDVPMHVYFPGFLFFYFMILSYLVTLLSS